MSLCLCMNINFLKGSISPWMLLVNTRLKSLDFGWQPLSYLAHLSWLPHQIICGTYDNGESYS